MIPERASASFKNKLQKRLLSNFKNYFKATKGQLFTFPWIFCLRQKVCRVKIKNFFWKPAQQATRKFYNWKKLLNFSEWVEFLFVKPKFSSVNLKKMNNKAVCLRNKKYLSPESWIIWNAKGWLKPEKYNAEGIRFVWFWFLNTTEKFLIK